MKPGVWIFIYFSSLTLLITACSNTSPEPPHEFEITEPIPPIRLGVSDSAENLAKLAKNVYQPKADQAALQITTGNDQTLLEMIAAEELDAALVFREPEGAEIWFERVALDGLVIITHPEVQLDDMGLQTLLTLFEGTVDNWSTFGQPNLPIILYGREEGSGTRSWFQKLVMNDNPVSPETLIAVNESDMLAEVNRVPGSIGYVMMASLDSQRALAINGLEAIPETVANGTYPLTVPIYLVAISEPSGDLGSFLAVLTSEYGQAQLGEKYGQLR